MYGSGVKSVTIRYHFARQNSSANALPRSPQASPSVPGVGQNELQVATISTDIGDPIPDIIIHPNADPAYTMPDSFASEQLKDRNLKENAEFLDKEELPYEEKRAWKIALQASLFTVQDQILF